MSLPNCANSSSASLPSSRQSVMRTSIASPLSAWIEDCFGLRDDNGQLRRQEPQRISEAAS